MFSGRQGVLRFWFAALGILLLSATAATGAEWRTIPPGSPKKLQLDLPWITEEKHSESWNDKYSIRRYLSLWKGANGEFAQIVALQIAPGYHFTRSITIESVLNFDYLRERSGYLWEAYPCSGDQCRMVRHKNGVCAAFTSRRGFVRRRGGDRSTGSTPGSDMIVGYYCGAGPGNAFPQDRAREIIENLRVVTDQ